MEVMYSSTFVCMLAGLRTTNRLVCTKFGAKVACEPLKKPLDFGCNADLDADQGIFKRNF